VNDKIRAPYDDRLIEPDNLIEMAYWVKFLSTTKDELLAAISEVGPQAHKVREHLREKGRRADAQGDLGEEGA
jgi:hypothetical protein